MFIQLISRSHTARGTSRNIFMSVVRADKHVLYSYASLSASRTLATFKSAEDLNDFHCKIIDGSAKVTDLSIRELKEYLGYRGISRKGCHDKKSLQKKVAGFLVVDPKKRNQMKAESKDHKDTVV